MTGPPFSSLLGFVLLAIATPAAAEPLQRGSSVTSPTGIDAPLKPPTDQGLTLSIGASDWSGDYGAKTTTDFSAALLSARYKFGDLRLTASIPWMRISSAGAVFAGIDGTPLIVAPQAGTNRTIRNGLGDLTLGASYLAASQEKLGVDLDLSARVKIPTASDDTGVSTGKADYAFTAEGSRAFGRFIPFASLSYRSFGDTDRWRLKDGFATSIGASYLFAGRTLGALSYEYAQRTSAFIPDSHQIVASASSRLGHSSLRLNGFIGAGLSNGAAAISGGLSLSKSF